MNLQEMFEALKAKYPRLKIHASENVGDDNWESVTRHYFYASIEGGGCGTSGDTPEAVIAALKVPDRIAQARQMIEDANKILVEEGEECFIPKGDAPVGDFS